MWFITMFVLVVLVLTLVLALVFDLTRDLDLNDIVLDDDDLHCRICWDGTAEYRYKFYPNWLYCFECADDRGLEDFIYLKDEEAMR
jgi:hypothetical protein